MIDTELLAQLRTKLEAEKEKLEGEFHSMGYRVGINPDGTADWASKPPEADDSEKDFTVQADRVEEFENTASKMSVLEARYADVCTALEKMNQKKYGVCEFDSKHEIESDRLTANPAARTCKIHMN